MKKLLVTHIQKKAVKILRFFSLTIITASKKIDKYSFLTNSTKELLNRNRIFKNKHKDKRAFVIVNGPSLKNQNIDGIENMNFNVFTIDGKLADYDIITNKIKFKEPNIYILKIKEKTIKIIVY